MTVSDEKFLEKVREIADENPSYRSGGSGEDGTCDCIGLVIGAMKRCGHGGYALHGSNYFARKQTVDLGVEASAVGMIVYKTREPEESGYALPEKYKEGGTYYTGDLKDYYHVGVVTSVSPIEITHCTSSGSVDGIKRDTTEKEYRKWKCAGYVKDVVYNDFECEEENDTMTATVYAADGNPVKMRKTANVNQRMYWKVPCGAEVQVELWGDEWSKVSYDGHTGYMMSAFLKKNSETGEGEEVDRLGDEEYSVGAGLLSDEEVESTSAVAQSGANLEDYVKREELEGYVERSEFEALCAKFEGLREENAALRERVAVLEGGDVGEEVNG